MNPFSRMLQLGSTATSFTHSYINFSLNSHTHTPKTMKRLFLSFLLVLVLLLSSSFTGPSMGKSLYCAGKCRERCRRAGVKDRCLKYCNICCAQCKCVPSGTYGNKHQCPCYRDMRNSKGKPKCP